MEISFPPNDILGMKSLVILTLFWVILSTPSLGKILTVSNNPDIKADYAGIQTAIEFSYSGDTIFVHGSPLNYGNIKVTKPLTIIGAGYNSNNPDGHSAKLLLIEFTNNLYHNTSSSNSTIQGFEFFFITGNKPGIITKPYANHIISNITLQGNRIWNLNIQHPTSGWKIKNNIIHGQLNGGCKSETGKGGANAFMITNNIIMNIKDFSQKNLFQNNVVMGELTNVSECTFLNNIFTYPQTLLTEVWNCTFRNNLTTHNNIGSVDCYLPYDDFKSFFNCLDKGKNIGANNIIGEDPSFVNLPNNKFDYSNDYQLNSASPGKNAGTDKKDLGIFGGPYPFPSWTEPYPIVLSFYKQPASSSPPKDPVPENLPEYRSQAITRKDKD